MVTLVTGGSGSGKSAYAEQEIMELGNRRRIYIATMKPWDEECRRRIERHRIMRAGKEFETVECFGAIETLEITGKQEENAVLLECLSNLVSNRLFGIGEGEEPDYLSAEYGAAVADSVVNGVLNLKRYAADIVIVTNEVFSAGDYIVKGDSVVWNDFVVRNDSAVRTDSVSWEDSTAFYLKILGEINCRLGAAADRVVEVTCGIPFVVKG